MIAEIRKNLNLTQEQLADVVGCTQGRISHMETGRTRIDVRFAKKLIRLAQQQGWQLTLDDILED